MPATDLPLIRLDLADLGREPLRLGYLAVIAETHTSLPLLAIHAPTAAGVIGAALGELGVDVEDFSWPVGAAGLANFNPANPASPQHVAALQFVLDLEPAAVDAAVQVVNLHDGRVLVIRRDPEL